MKNSVNKIAILLVLFFCFETALADATRPNILLISADDLGFDDLAIHNNPVVSTPHIDTLAEKSVVFTDFAVSPVCSTTRASLMTGRQFYKTGVSGVHGGRDYLNKKEVLISQMLKKNGYSTGFWGKWHTGKSKGYFPWERGFDEGYYAELYQHENSHGFLNGNHVTHNKWVSEVITDYAMNFIRNSQKTKTPFFAYVSYLAPHEPWLAPDEFVTPYLEKNLRPAIANLYGMVSEMDFHIGRLVSFIEDANLSEDTIIIFMSDNGPWWDSSNFGAMTLQEWIARNPSGLRGNKGQSWQNGIKSPLFVKNIARFPPAEVKRFVNVNDITPTILEMTNTAKPARAKSLDGISFLPYLLGETQGENTREFYIASHDVNSSKKHFNQWTPIDPVARAKMSFDAQQIGLRTEQYKLLLNPAIDKPSYPKAIENFALFSMTDDTQENTNIIKDNPSVTQKLKQRLFNLFSSIKNAPASFIAPEYTIDGEASISVINAFGPSSTYGNTVSKAHVLSGLKAKGDGAIYNIKVKDSGKFKLYIEQTNTDAVGFTVRINSGAEVISAELDGSKIQYVGEMLISKNEDKFTFEVTGSNSMKPWGAISGLRRFYFVPANLNTLPSSVKFPN